MCGKGVWWVEWVVDMFHLSSFVSSFVFMFCFVFSYSTFLSNVFVAREIEPPLPLNKFGNG